MSKKENVLKIEEERSKGGFECCGCGKWVDISDNVGTAHRNHCPHCLSSKHLDDEFSGDRASVCEGCMKPIGLTFKKEGTDKYGKERKGELMIIHECEKCGRVSINRLSADDDDGAILSLFGDSLGMEENKKNMLVGSGIDVADSGAKEDIFIRLFGKGINKF
jgi:hypothetical protein